MISDTIKIVEEIEFEKSIYQFREDGIVLITVKDGVHMEIEDSIREHEMLKKKPEYLPLRVLIKSGVNSSTSREVRDYANSYDARKIMRAQAIVVQSLAQKIMADFIMKFYKVPVNLKLFKNEEKAIEWLKEQ